MGIHENITLERKIKVLSSGKPDMKQIAKIICGKSELDEPFYICDLGDLIRKHEQWIAHMPRVKPFYAVKCNDDPLVLQTLSGLGTGFDCASKAEINKIMELGVSPSDVIFANPTKLSSHIKVAASFDVKTMTFDNATELAKIKKFHPTAQLVIRLRCDAQKAQCQLGMKFGVLPQDAPELLAIAKSLDLDVVGVSFHVGSGCMDPPVFNRAIASAKWLFHVASDLGFDFHLLDIGGGFPGNSHKAFKEIADIVNKSLEDYFPQSSGVEVIAEPGRFYVASAYSLCTQVHSIRKLVANNDESDDETHYMYYINDGVYGSFNCLVYDHAEVVPEPLIANGRNDMKHSSSIWGPTCDGLDVVCNQVKLPELKIGEWIFFKDMGAYTMVAAGTFNGFPVPKVIYVTSQMALNTLRELLDPESFIDDNIPLFVTSGVGCNRDAVGWEIALGDVMTGSNSNNHPVVGTQDVLLNLVES